jgi:hypothetical protein
MHMLAHRTCRALGSSYLSDPQCSPLLFPEQLECASSAIEVVFGDDLQHLLGQLDVSVLEVVVRVSAQVVSKRARSVGPAVNNSPCRVVDRINKLVQLLLLVLRQRARLLVAAREVDVHVGSHFAAVCVCDANARVLVQCVVRVWMWWGSGQGFG